MIARALHRLHCLIWGHAWANFSYASWCIHCGLHR